MEALVACSCDRKSGKGVAGHIACRLRCEMHTASIQTEKKKNTRKIAPHAANKIARQDAKTVATGRAAGRSVETRPVSMLFGMRPFLCGRLLHAQRGGAAASADDAQNANVLGHSRDGVVPGHLRERARHDVATTDELCATHRIHVVRRRRDMGRWRRFGGLCHRSRSQLVRHRKHGVRDLPLGEFATASPGKGGHSSRFMRQPR